MFVHNPRLSEPRQQLKRRKSLVVFKGELNPKIKFVLFERTHKVTE